MSEWREAVSLRLERAGLRLPPEDENVEELAGHLEDLAADPLLGREGENAALRAVNDGADWKELRRAIRNFRQEDDMNERVRRVWLPAMAAIAVGHGLWWGMLAVGLTPTIVWDDSRPLMLFFLPWLCLLPLVGAMGAYWSRHAGGGRRDATVVSLAPALGFAVVFVLALAVQVIVGNDMTSVPRTFQMKLIAATFFSLVGVPSVALMAGALPFLRERATT